MRSLTESEMRMRDAFLEKAERREYLWKMQNDLTAERDAQAKELETASEVHMVIQAGAEIVQQGLHEKIASVVTKCLHAVFPDPYDLTIEFEQLANRTEARLRFLKNGEVVNPSGGSGGGAIDVAALALRMVCLAMETDTRRLIVLDEPFRFISEEYAPAVRRMLEALAKEMGVQVVMVTHNQDLRTGKIIEVGA